MSVAQPAHAVLRPTARKPTPGLPQQHPPPTFWMTGKSRTSRQMIQTIQLRRAARATAAKPPPPPPDAPGGPLFRPAGSSASPPPSPGGTLPAPTLRLRASPPPQTGRLSVTLSPDSQPAPTLHLELPPSPTTLPMPSPPKAPAAARQLDTPKASTFLAAAALFLKAPKTLDAGADKLHKPLKKPKTLNGGEKSVSSTLSTLKRNLRHSARMAASALLYAA